jgi:16S rRNA (cytosine1402-N4)-methyltransferase
MIHKSVLLNEAIDGLDIHAGDVFVDGTLGNGGHTEEVLRRFGKQVKIFAIDADSEAIIRAKERLEHFGGDITYILGNFRNMKDLLVGAGIESVDKILLDIGMSSNQLEEGKRGFSFRADEPLNMSFKKEIADDDWTAEKIVNTWDEDSLRTVIKAYGEERFAGRIAKGIVKAREVSQIKTTTDLVNIILASTPAVYHRQRLHPATRTFQALRITVNDELQALQEGIENGFRLLNKDGRLAVISFHSLEDRMVKNYFKLLQADKVVERITKKPVVPQDEEVSENPRSRSAKLRIIHKN